MITKPDSFGIKLLANPTQRLHLCRALMPTLTQKTGMATPDLWLWAVTRRLPELRRAAQAHGRRSWLPLCRPQLTQTVSTRHKLLPCAPLLHGLRRNPRCSSSLPGSIRLSMS